MRRVRVALSRAMRWTSARSLFVFSASALLALGAMTACASSHEGETIGESESALKRKDIEQDEPRAPRDAGTGGADTSVPPRPPTVVIQPLPPILVLQPTYCGDPKEFTLRRAMAGDTCSAIPNTVIEPNGNRYVYDTYGRYRIYAMPMPASAPVEFRDRTCKITFEKACSAPANAFSNPRATLSLAPTDSLVDANLHFYGGIGHCDVCGYASGSHMWAVLPWDYFTFEIDSQQYTHEVAPELTVFEFELPTSVQPQDVRIRRGGPF